MILEPRNAVKALNDFIEHAPMGTFVFERASGKIIYANPRAGQILNLPMEELLQFTSHLTRVARLDGTELSFDEWATTQARKTGEIHEHTVEVTYEDGRQWCLQVSAVPVNGHVFTQFADITAVVQADRMRRQFEANTSHELRTPVALIHGFAEQLIHYGHEFTPEQTTRFLHIIHNKAEDMIWLLNNVLLVFKVQEGAPAHFAQMNLTEAVDETAEAMVVLAQKHQVAFGHITEPGITIVGNAVEIRLMLNNLMMNAIKFSPGGTVQVSLTAENNEAVIRVADTGIGMSPELLHKIFLPFVQGDGSDTRRFGGTGIGLYVVDLLVQRHNGRIEVVSELGKGSTFTVRFPLDGSTQ